MRKMCDILQNVIDKYGMILKNYYDYMYSLG